MRAADEKASEYISTLQTDNDVLRVEVEMLKHDLAVAIDQIRRMQQDRECVD